MKRVFGSLCLCLFLFNLNAQQFKLDTLVYNGNPDNRINFVILGDGYLESQLPEFRVAADKLVADVFNSSPFLEYKEYFNVFVIEVPSNVEGAASDPANLIDNYFGSTFNFGGIQRLLVPTRIDKATALLAETFPFYDQIMLLVNSTMYGGSGGTIATSSVNEQSSEIAIHELGHSFGSLADEYWAGYAYEAPNMTYESKPGSVKWKNWLNDFGIGIYPHSVNPSVYKPHRNCKMQFLGNPFCAVCSEQFINRIHELTTFVDSYEVISEQDEIGFKLKLIQTEPNSLKINWNLNETLIAQKSDELKVSKTSLLPGKNVLEAIVIDSTVLNRRNTVYTVRIKWNIDATITSEDQKLLEPRTKDVITVTEGEVENFKLAIFPNPTQDEFEVEYELTKATPVEIVLLDSHGKTLKSKRDIGKHPGKFRVKFRLADYSNGLYFVKFKTESISHSFRIVKIN